MKALISFYALLFILCTIFLTGCGIGSASEGTHRGHITDVSVSGWFCKTYEGQIQTGSGQSSVKYEFTVDSPSVFAQLRRAQETGQEVNITYYSPTFYSFCSSAHPNIVTGVKPMLSGGAGLSGGVGTGGL